jgi:hypothetical protein
MKNNIETTESLLKLWGLYQPKLGTQHLGFAAVSMSGLNSLSQGEAGLPKEAESALVDISVAVASLEQSEPKVARAVIARYLYGDSLKTIGDNLGGLTGGAVAKLCLSGVAWISGYLEGDSLS